MSASALTFLVLGSSNLFGRVPNGPSMAPGLISLPLINQDPMQFQAALYNYTYSPGIGAHKVRSTLKTWNAARKACEEDGGHLLIINSDAESRVVVQLLRKHNVDNGWVGIHDHYEESEFVTIHGESLAKAGFDEWLPGEPNNVGNEENCAIVTTAGKFLDINCKTPSSYICELSGVQSYVMQLPGYVGVSLASDLVNPSGV